MTMNIFNQFASPTYLGLPLFLIALLMPWFLFPSSCHRWLSNRTISVQTWVTKNFTKQIFYSLSQKTHNWALILTTLMMFLLSMNMLGLLPYTFTPTTQLSLNLGLAVPLWLATVLIGLINQPTVSLSHLLPEGTPNPLIPALIIIESISLLIRPMALGVRLTANLTAGHLLIQLISSAVMTIFSISHTLSLITFIVLLLLTMLEIAVAAIQAYVFILLLSLYLQENN
uniref:ATP synthase subunit a n=1 Tax=Cryptobatrachus sp. TNHC-GDC 451 TaxID=1338817 RepID=S4UZX5_9NEOB|nr:ATP synthase F0 subunit 6 [Cryptobatrachus sp. TNHC-GDC 451]